MINPETQAMLKIIRAQNKGEKTPKQINKQNAHIES